MDTKKTGAEQAAEAFARVASTKDTSPEDVKKLLAEIADLKAKLEIETQARTEAEQAALEAAQAQGALMQSEIREVPTGKKVPVQRVKEYEVRGYKDDGREIMKPVFHTVKLPTFYYKIDIPPVGGLDIKINSLPLYHGTVYEFDIDTLRTVKEIVFRCWDHDKNIHGSDENFYREPVKAHFSGRTGGRVA